MPPFERQGEKPLFPQVLWNRPVARGTAGRLLIVGGHRGDFSLPTTMHELSLAAGIGQATVVLPDALRSLLAGAPDVVFAPSSPAGSLGRLAQGEILELASRHDGVLLSGLGNNSETILLTEALIQQYTGPLIISGSDLAHLSHQLPGLTQRQNLLLVLTWPELLRLAGRLGQGLQLNQSDLSAKLNILKIIVDQGACSYLAVGPELIASADVPTVTAAPGSTINLAAVIATAAAFWVQVPSQPAAAVTTAAFILSQALPDHEAPIAQLSKSLSESLAKY